METNHPFERAAPAERAGLPGRAVRATLRARRRRSFPASSALAGVLTAAMISAACSGNHRPATPGTAGVAIERGMASWYGPGFDGRPTANGERYDRHGLTAAHPSLPFGTLVQVTNLENGRQVVVRINDRGPFSRHRIIDLSYAAASQLAMVGPGTARVELAIFGHGEIMTPPPLLPAPPIVLAAAPEPTAPLAEPAVDRSLERPAAIATEGIELAAGAAGAEPAEVAEPFETRPVARAAAVGDLPVGAIGAIGAVGAGATESSPAAGSLRFTVQVGAFGDPERAEALQHDLVRLYPETAVHSDGTWNRVQIGLFAGREAAERLRRELTAKGLSAVVVTAR